MRTILGIPEFRPMLAETADRPFDDAAWLFEVKWDGYRCLCYIRRESSSGEIRLVSRNGNDLGRDFPELCGMWAGFQGTSAVVDGEIVAVSGGKPDFGTLRRRQGVPVYVAFDLLYLDGEDLSGLPLLERRARLKEHFRFGGNIVFSEDVRGEGNRLFSLIKARDLEGMMCKHILSPYVCGRRTRYWLKVRNGKEAWFTVLGYRGTPGMKIGSLIVGEVEGDRVVIRGSVSSGLGAAEERQLAKLLRPLDPGGVPAGSRSDVTWVVPEVRVLVSYTELTGQGKLRHAVLRGIAGK